MSVFSHSEPPAHALRRLLAAPGLLVAPGAGDALTARLIVEAGFPAVYASGAAIANSLLGAPDIGLVSFSESLETVRHICESVAAPVIADADTGYGNAVNVLRTVRAFEAAGAAAIQLEDQVSPKRCGHFDGKEVIEAAEMAHKIRAAVDARRDSAFVIIARTDSLATHGFEEAVRRGRRYAEAGADVIFVDAPITREQVAALPAAVGAPMLFNMVEGAKTPLFSHAELVAFGYRIVIHPSLVLRVAAKAGLEALRALKRNGDSRDALPRMLDWDERQRLVQLPEYIALEKRYAQ